MNHWPFCPGETAYCSECSSGPVTFLHLPVELRDRIYRQSGLLSGAVVGIKHQYDVPNVCTDRAPPGEPLPYTFNPRPSDAYVSRADLAHHLTLRRVTRVVRIDVARFLYANNRIVIRCSPGISLWPLIICAPDAVLESARHLTVLLRVCWTARQSRSSCMECPDCPYRLYQGHTQFAMDTLENRRARASCQYGFEDCSCVGPPTGYLSAEDRIESFEELWEDWCDLVCRLSLLENMSKLRMHVCCDAADVEMAEMIKQSLDIEGLNFASCTVRLGARRSLVLDDIAHQAVVRATGGKTITRRAFRFLDLPTEIRHHILSYTDLVTPLREVEWSPWPWECFRHPWSACSPFPCPSREFCSNEHAVYPPCKCWAPPDLLFLVCRTMLHDARAVFYSSNRFIVTPRMNLRDEPRQVYFDPLRIRPIDMGKPDFPEPTRFHASIFLSRLMSRGTLQYLRTLEIYCPSTMHLYFSWDHRAREDWMQTIKSAASQTNRLALRLYMGYTDQRIPHQIFHLQVRSAQRIIFDIHEEIVAPLAHLTHQGKVDFVLIEASLPFAYREHEWDSVGEEIEEHKRHLRRLIMGDRTNDARTELLQKVESMWLSEKWSHGFNFISTTWVSLSD